MEHASQMFRKFGEREVALLARFGSFAEGPRL